MLLPGSVSTISGGDEILDPVDVSAMNTESPTLEVPHISVVENLPTLSEDIMASAEEIVEHKGSSVFAFYDHAFALMTVANVLGLRDQVISKIITNNKNRPSIGPDGAIIIASNAESSNVAGDCSLLGIEVVHPDTFVQSSLRSKVDAEWHEQIINSKGELIFHGGITDHLSLLLTKGLLYPDEDHGIALYHDLVQSISIDRSVDPAYGDEYYKHYSGQVTQEFVHKLAALRVCFPLDYPKHKMSQDEVDFLIEALPNYSFGSPTHYMLFIAELLICTAEEISVDPAEGFVLKHHKNDHRLEKDKVSSKVPVGRMI